MGFLQAPALPYSKLGIVEDGDTASQAIEKDKYVIWKGKNYFAKTDILQGETFVADTNLTEIPDGALNGIVDALSASKILWTNTSPTSTFAAQTIQIDLSEYQLVRINFRRHTSQAEYINIYGEMDQTTLAIGTASLTNSGNIHTRTFTMSTTGITFGDGYMLDQKDNGRMIPCKIYGIKRSV